MAVYMDTHRNLGDIEKEKVDEAYKKDLAVQRKYGVDITDTGTAKKTGYFLPCTSSDQEGLWSCPL